VSSNNTQLTEKDLVKRVLQGDTLAFGVVVGRTEGLVARIVFKMIDNPEDRKDIVQDIYLRTYKNLAEFQFRSKLSTWIAHITYNTCLNYLEKKKLVLPGDDHHGEETGEGDEQEHGVTTADTGPETLIVKKELSGILAAEIERLRPLFKTLIVLYHQEELSYGEIAEITGLPQGTIKSYLFRARKTLKENILAQYKKEEL
jgi:RNA polymerase sigma-70 factor (ECF subfamily)